MTRSDGRGADELRPIRIARGVQPFAEGSCLIEVGMTRVLCAASVDERVPDFLRGTGSGWVTAEYSMLPRSTVVRTPREVRSGRPSGRTQEIQRLIGRALRAVTDLTSLGERTITVDCDVVVADGGTRTASISGAYVALVEALRKVVAGGGLDRIPVAEEIAAVSVGIVEGGTILDLSYEEDSAASVDMNVAMTASGGLVEVQGTAEGDPFNREQLDGLLDLAATGIGQICKLQREALGES